MIEALDAELSRLLVSIGIAGRKHDGTLNYNPHDNDTMVVILGDNGTLGNAVKFPFDGTRAKGTAYQTGVWVPLIVAGPVVKQPDREVGYMVNVADLYQLFGELAGIDVPASVPRRLDSVSMLPYLTNSRQGSIRSSNFTQVGTNIQAGLAVNQPCSIGASCTQIPVSKSVCEDNAGTWWGNDPTSPDKDPATTGAPEDGFAYCCEVNQFVYEKATDPANPNYDPTLQVYDLQPLSAAAIRNDAYKVVRNFFKGNPDASEDQQNGIAPTCSTAANKDEFYLIDESATDPKLDEEGDDLFEQANGLTAAQQAVYDDLSQQLDLVLQSEQPCPRVPPSDSYQFTIDGNLDGVVDRKDLDAWSYFADLSRGGSSWYDVNLDGYTDGADYDLIVPFLATRCPAE
jgi:hypothetical protein